MAVVETEGRVGGKVWTSPPRVVSLKQPGGSSLVKSSSLYLCDWSGRGIYTQHGSVRSGHRFPNFQSEQTARETVCRRARVTE